MTVCHGPKRLTERHRPPLSPRTLPMQLTDRQTQVLATIATITAVSMYVSYIPQIQMNLAGQKGSALQPLVAAINCTLWVIYALFKPQRDIPVALANAPGIVLGLITFWTAL